MSDARPKQHNLRAEDILAVEWVNPSPVPAGGVKLSHVAENPLQRFYVLPRVEQEQKLPSTIDEINQETLKLLAATAVFEDCIFGSLYGARVYPAGEHIAALAFYFSRLNAAPAEWWRSIAAQSDPVEFGGQRWPTYHDAAFMLCAMRFVELFNFSRRRSKFPVDRLYRQVPLSEFVSQVTPQFSIVRQKWRLPRLNVEELEQLTIP